MAARLLNRVLGLCGLRLTRTGRKRAHTALDVELQTIVRLVSNEPTNYRRHLDLSAHASRAGNPFLAHACARSAAWLAPVEPETQAAVLSTASQLPATLNVGHNTYHRLHAMAQALAELGCGPASSVLDVGGGHGALSAFLPDAGYFLADKTTSGVAASDLGAQYGQFDFAVASHVLEHVPVDQRELFLDSLLARANVVVLLNPFKSEVLDDTGHLRLVHEIVGSAWAEEHLQCTLPKIEDVTSYARARGLEHSSRPMGSYTTTLAWVFVEHFASAAGRTEELGVVNRYFNAKLSDLEQIDPFPTGFLVTLGLVPVSSGRRRPSEQ